MYSNLPFTGAPLIYLALGLFFVVAGLSIRTIDFVRSKTKSRSKALK